MVDSRHRRSRETKVEKIACFAANNDVSTASDLSTAVYCSKSASIFSKPAKIQENCAISKPGCIAIFISASRRNH